AELSAGRSGVLVLTTAVQVDHLFAIAGDAGPALARALRERTVVAAIGPTAAEALAARGIPADLVASPPKLGPLVAALARGAPKRLAAKRGGSAGTAHEERSRP